MKIFFNLRTLVAALLIGLLFGQVGCAKMMKRNKAVPTLEIVEPEPPKEVERPEPKAEKKKKSGGLLSIFRGKKEKEQQQFIPESPITQPPPSDTRSAVELLPVGADKDSTIRTLEERLQVGDNVGISLGDPINWQSTDKIDIKGNVNLPIIGSFPAAGKTTSELEQGISDIYVARKIVRSFLHVTVNTSVKSYYIQGEIGGPGKYPLVPPMTLTKAIAAAGGFGPWADKTNIKIYRGRDVYKIDYKKIEGDIRLDVEIQANDLINVPKDGGLLNLDRE